MKFEINGNKYETKPFGFNLVCDLDELGVNIMTANQKPMSVARAYFALCSGKSLDEAGMEIEQHLINGGAIDGLVNAMSKEIEKSRFFQNRSKAENPTT